MNRNEKAIVGLVAAVAGIVVLNKYAAKEAKALGIPMVAVSAAIWALS
jgi:drug/metabolite transporter (DMT)-like permease